MQFGLKEPQKGVKAPSIRDVVGGKKYFRILSLNNKQI